MTSSNPQQPATTVNGGQEGAKVGGVWQLLDQDGAWIDFDTPEALLANIAFLQQAIVRYSPTVVPLVQRGR